MMGAAGVVVGAWLLTAGREARCDALKKSCQGLVFGFQLFLPPGRGSWPVSFSYLIDYVIMRRKRRKKINQGR